MRELAGERNNVSDTTEDWRSIVAFPGYEISDLGRIRSHRLRQVRILQPRFCRGYQVASLRKDRHTYYSRLSHLVLEAFVGPCPDGMESAHLNGQRADNRSTNLQWCSHIENIAHKHLHGTYTRGEQHPPARLRQWQVDELRERINSGEKLTSELAKEYGVAYGTVRHVIRGDTWAAKP